MAHKVTRLRFQTRNPERVNVYLDGAHAFSLPAVEAARLHKGQVLTEDEIHELQDRDGIQRTLDKALRFLSYRPRSEEEIRRYLVGRGEPETRVEAVVEKLRASEWLDDEAFVRFWVENRRSFRPRGRWALRYELRQKGVSDEIIEMALIDLDTESQAADLALRQARRWQGLEYRLFRKRMLDYLMRRGFEYAEAIQAVEQAWEHVGGNKVASQT